MVSASMADTREIARRWHGVLGRLQLEVNTHSFKTWLEGTRPLHLDGSMLTVEAASSFSCEWLNERMAMVVERAASNVFERDLQVRFVPRGSSAEAAPNETYERAVERAPEEPAGSAGATLQGRINTRFTFDRYLPAEGNRLALESCTSLLKEELRIHEVVVVYGSPGMGKTHLLHAVCARAADLGWRVAYLSGEEFTTRYQRCLRGGGLEELQCELRGVQLFVLDDLQYLTGKKATQDELVHTIEAVTNSGGYVLMAGEAHPAHLDLAERLATRLSAGVATRVDPFLLGERRCYIEQLAREHRVSLPGWAVERIAGCEVPSVRLLQGIVNAAVLMQRNNMLDLRRLDAKLMEITAGASTAAGLEDREVLERIARHFEVKFDELTGRSRRAAVGEARAVAAWALQSRGRSLSEVGDLLGGRNKSTIKEIAERGKEIAGREAGLALASGW